MRYAFVLSVLLWGSQLGSGTAWAQQPQQPLLTYTGLVVNGGMQPLSGVSVLLSGTSTAVTTNSEGRFLLQAPAGQHTFIFDYPGHLEVRLLVSQPDSTLVVKLHSTQPRVRPRGKAPRPGQGS
ncbi:MAG: carboxypeptidase-like regulatory domain-containing protein [Hymenobacter sp.]|nr:carboxypeptidase-like regulatory domain-containing protein [Hymenobacter sp.]